MQIFSRECFHHGQWLRLLAVEARIKEELLVEAKIIKGAGLHGPLFGSHVAHGSVRLLQDIFDIRVVGMLQRSRSGQPIRKRIRIRRGDELPAWS